MSFPTNKQLSSKAYYQSSPIQTLGPDYSYSKGSRSLNEVRNWSEKQTGDWLCQLNLDRFIASFKEHNITGAVLLDLDNESLKAMEITPVGERVRLCVAVKALRQECSQSGYVHGFLKQGQCDALFSDLSSPPQQLPDLPANQNDVYDVDPSSVPTILSSHHRTDILNASPPPSKILYDPKGTLEHSSSDSRFLGRTDIKQVSAASDGTAFTTNTNASPYQEVHYCNPSSSRPRPRTVSKRSSFEGGIMSMEKVKQTCVKVFGEDGQTRIVNVHNTSGARMVMSKVLHKFGIAESNADQYCIFVGSSVNGEARTLSDTELNDICRSTDRPEKERLILRKRHMYPTHEEFKRKGTANATWQLQGASPTDGSGTSNDSSTKYSLLVTSILPTSSNRRPDSLYITVDNNSTPTLPSNYPRAKRFFGERPPSDVISSNLTSFFPNHEPDILETAEMNVKRLSTTQRVSVVSRYERQSSNSKNSVLSELVQELGVNIDNLDDEKKHNDIDFGNPRNDDTYQPTNISIPYETSKTCSTSASRNSTNTARSSVLSSLEEYQAMKNDNIDDESSNALDYEAPPEQELISQQNHSDSPLYVNNSIPPVIHTLNEMSSSSVYTQTATSGESGLPWMKGALIGRGTFGDVYLGLNPVSGELMAVKQVELPVENSSSEGRRKHMVGALRREIALLQELHHENIVPYLGSRSDNTYFSIFLEYVPGGSVAGLLASYGAFQEPLIKSFVRQILRGLAYLHGKDIVHRDIKGANVLVDNKGGVKISDFGISKKLEGDLMDMASTGSQRPSFQGSIFWMAPEVVKQTQYTHKADIWSVGCMVVEMFTGDHPFPEYSQMQAIFQIGSDAAPDIPAHICADGKDFLKCAFQLDHEKRPAACELLSHPFLVTVNA